MRDLGIYVHIPFCIRKCNYCDFLSGPAEDSIKEEYQSALLHEIEEAAETEEVVEDFLVKTIFIGGGTPTAVPSHFIKEILCKLKKIFSVDENAEITLECNPGTVDEEKLATYRKAGVNRLSIGLQSTSNSELKCLGRIHTYEQFLTTYELARKSGFTNINVDLMSSVPEQTLPSFQDTLQKVTALSPEHISVYSLIIEEGTPFYEEQDSLKLPDEDTEMEIDQYTRAYLKEQGYLRYEISNYAKPGFECRHNEVYWKRGSYLGFGIGAASLMEFGEDRNYRFSNITSLEEYVGILLPEREREKEWVDFKSLKKLWENERMEEFMYLGLRMIRGVCAEDFYRMFHKDITKVYEKQFAKLTSEGLLEIERQGADTRIFLTERGLDVSNVALAQFLF